MTDTSNPFQIAGQGVNEVKANALTGDLKSRIEAIIQSAKIVLFMKGNADFPQCGFSANTVAILKHLGAQFNTFDILSDQDIRQGLKEYSNWPTFPQLYINNVLVGGNDIITEMFEEGELQELISSL